MNKPFLFLLFNILIAGKLTYAMNNPKRKTLAEVLITAASHSVDEVKVLLDCGASPDEQDQYGATALMKASMLGNVPICTLLLERKANVNLGDINGWTALHNAAAGYRKDACKLLLEHNAHINAQDRWGKTPLAYAKDYNKFDMCAFLVERGAK